MVKNRRNTMPLQSGTLLGAGQLRENIIKQKKDVLAVSEALAKFSLVGMPLKQTL